MLSHRRRWLVPPLTAATGILYTIPSIAFFFLLLPITGRGNVTAVIALTAYTLQILYRNITAGLANVPGESKDAGRGMGMSDRQLLWRVELPLALPEIIAGLRIATVSTVAIATLAVFAGGDGLGSELVGLEHHLQDRGDPRRRPGDPDRAHLRPAARARRPDARAVAKGAGRYERTCCISPTSSARSATRSTSSSARSRPPSPAARWAGPPTCSTSSPPTSRSAAPRSSVAIVIALPIGVWLGHRGKGEGLAIAVGNAGRAIPELVLIAFLVAFVGLGFANVVIALAVLGIPPILTNSFVGVARSTATPSRRRGAWG